jgi:DNA-binding CsgD family transcriptional regulator/tetratricopeptide (TPR) repeat protein
MDLLERDHELEVLESALDRAIQGNGSVVAISGEAGIGKTELVHAFVGSHRDRLPILWGGCDDLSTPRTLGPFHDIAIQVGGALKDLLGSSAQRGDVLDAIFELLDGGRPATVAVVEDVHWADGATLDVLKFLGRRIDRTPALLVFTYRAEEVGPDHPLPLVIGDLPPNSVHRLQLLPLSKEAVASLAPEYSEAPDELFEATGGNPFLLTEALSVPGLSPSAAVRDAVLVRASRLSPGAHDLAELVAVVPTQAERSLLSHLSDASPEILEECRQRGLMEYDEVWIWYRHELVRSAMHESLTKERRRTLNAAILRELISSNADVARIVHHARQASDHEAIARYAPAAARQASAAAAHKEAIAHYRLACEHAENVEKGDRAALLSEFAIECYLGNEVAEALDLSERALVLWRRMADAEHQGEILRWQSRFHWWLGHAESAEQTGRAAVEILETVPDSTGLPMAYSNLAQLAMLAQDFQPAVDWSEKAMAAAAARNDHATMSHALNNLGSARVRVGDAAGSELLKKSLAIALEHRLDDHAGRAYANLIWIALDCRDYKTADGYLEEGIAYAVKRDLGGSLHYMTSERARLRFERGEWPGADADVRWVLTRPEEPGITRMPALALRARLAVRRGDPDARKAIDDAWSLAEPTGELQRIAPVAVARAELAWLEQDHAAVRAAAAGAYRLAASVGQAWVTDELAFWMWRSGDPNVDLGNSTTPFALQATGHWPEAAAAWESLGCPYERSQALFDSDDSAHLLEALELLDALGAIPAGRLVRAKLHSLGLRQIPRGPRPTTRANPAGLTPRQSDVLGLLVEGCTNAEIADALFISPKTVDHHVSAVLAKLEVSSRREAARIAVDLGLVEPE